jgi:hypothetical protein
MILTEKELKWLEEREAPLYKCVKCKHHYVRSGCQYIPPYLDDFCHLDADNQDWQDVAEFEARVAMKVNIELLDISPCFQADVCVEPHLFKYNDGGNGDGCNMCRLKYARMAVEADMEKKWSIG